MKKKPRKLPKARTSFCCLIPQLKRIGWTTSEVRDYFSAEEKKLIFPCAIIPCRTRKEARALCRAHTNSNA